MKWAVEIQKTSLEPRILADLLDGLGFNLIDGIEFPAFTSPRLVGCETAADVFEEAKKLRAAFTGINEEFSLGSVIDYAFNPPRPHAFLEVDTVVCNMSFGGARLTVLPPNGLSSEELETWQKEHAEREYEAELEHKRAKLIPAYWEPRAAKVLELLSNKNHTGETIYKIYELVEWESERRVFQAQFGISENEFRRFKDAVHNPEVSGDSARHAKGQTLNSTNPMTIYEAEAFVRNIASKWLEYVRTLCI